MILAFDTYHTANQAKTVAIAFEKWTDTMPQNIYIDIKTDIDDYESGAFYKRELPCIIQLLAKIDITYLQAIVIDGFVVLDDMGKLGLGGHLFHYLEEKIPVIGVAKTNFASLNALKSHVLRGKSQKPLYITVLGMQIDVAMENIRQMAGEFRMPNLLKQLDSLTKAE